MTPEELAAEAAEQIIQTAFDMGVELADSGQAIAEYASQRAVHLSTLVGQPGYAQAMQAERDNVALWAGIAASDQASAADQRMIGLIQGILSIGARVLL